MEKKVILFDLDGTLTDSADGIIKSVSYALSKMGIEHNPEELVCFVGPPLMDSFMTFYKMDETQSREAIRLYRERYGATGIFENRMYEDVPETMNKLLNDGYRLGIATCKPEKFAKIVCDKFDMTKYFEAICGTAMDAGVQTTKAEVIADALGRLGVSASETVMVGDRHHDIEGAKSHNMTSVGVTYGYARAGELESAGADYIIDSLKELTDRELITRICHA